MIAVRKERRLFERFTARFPGKLRDKKNQTWIHIFLKNVSAQGINFMTPKSVKVDENVILTVDLPNSDDPVKLRGTVKWVKSNAGNLCEVGVKLRRNHLLDTERIIESSRNEK